MPYDIFISYRREGGEKTARLIQLLLEKYGYRVFLDYDACNTDSWEKKIKTGIEDSKVFLFILSLGSLDKCHNEGDWVRKEVEYAYDLHKNIIPINPDKEFGDFPNDCPQSVRKALGQHTFFEIYTTQHLRTTVEALVEQRIKEFISPTQEEDKGASIYLETDVDSQIELFDKPLCALEAGVSKEVRLRKGTKKITAISIENPVDRVVQKYKVESDDMDDWWRIELLPIREARKAQEEKERQAKYTGHEWVDLGLSVKWATCNIGAATPEEYGDYYAWGETRTKSTYTEDNSTTYGKTYGDISGDARYDAARANWGGSWRMPTKAECQELVNNCTWQWTNKNGVAGYKVIGKNGNSIFLPAAGHRKGSSLDDAGEYGYYWGSTPDESSTEAANNYFFYFSHSGDDYFTGGGYRYYGFTVRPVSELCESKEQYPGGGSMEVARQALANQTSQLRAPIVATLKGNDPCPCGSGIKYKNCHGREQ